MPLREQCEQQGLRAVSEIRHTKNRCFCETGKLDNVTPAAQVVRQPGETGSNNFYWRRTIEKADAKENKKQVDASRVRQERQHATRTDMLQLGRHLTA